VRRRFFPAVEGMRGFAALAVLLGHVLVFGYGETGTRHTIGVWLGVLGVVVFFVISGFLLYRPFLAARHEGRGVGAITPSYLFRRAVRIFPAYWVALTVGASIVTLSGVFTGDWWIYYGLLQIYFPTKQLFGLPVAWTLCIEVSFYLALPLIALLLAKRGAGSGHRHSLLWEFGVLATLAAASLAFSAIVVFDPNLSFLTNTIGGLLIWFVGGMMLAALQVVHPASLTTVRKLLARPELCWPLGIGLFLVPPLEGLNGLPPRLLAISSPLVVGVAAALMMAPATLGDEGALVRRALTNRWMVYAGTISYGIYLWHLPILVWLEIHIPDAVEWHPILTLGGLTLIGGVLAGSASWFLIEKPLMQRVRSVKGSFGLRRGQRRARPKPEVPAPESEPTAEPAP
jgi:peptidoglycan/LPS O-acetylase OafA/YrhL